MFYIIIKLIIFYIGILVIHMVLYRKLNSDTNMRNFY